MQGTELVPRPGAVEEHRSRRARRAGPRDAAHAGTLALGLAALGVVFGDIGTSPLYAFRTVFSIDGGVVRPTPGDVHGVVSLVFWSILLIVSVKYVVFVLRADNDGEGGVMALAALVRRALQGVSARTLSVVMALGVAGASLFYGDSVINPEISVLHAERVVRVPGTAVFPHPTKETTPLALRAEVRHNGVLHERVVIVSGTTANVPHIPWEQPLAVNPLGDPRDGIVHIAAEFGFQDRTDFPEVLRRASAQHPRGLEGELDPDTASYFLSRITLRRTKQPGMSARRKVLFTGLAHNAASQADFLCLLDDRTVVMGSHVDL